MIYQLLRENCSHCLKSMYIGQPFFECANCNFVAHSRCFTHSKSDIINHKYYCSTCKDTIEIKYNPFKNFQYDDVHRDYDEETLKISNFLENCRSYNAQELEASHASNFKQFGSSYFLNIDGNKSNFNSLVAELHRIGHKFTAIGLAETNVSSAESQVYALPDYNSFYQNNQANKTKGTGVALYVLDKLNTVVNEQVSDVTANLESLFVTSRTNNQVATFGVIYRPPSGDFSSFLRELSKILELLPKRSVQIMGDFNVNLHANNKEVNEFEEIMFSAGFFPLISTHTHEKPGCNQTCIDNIFTNDIDRSVASGTISDKLSHHSPIFHIFDNMSTLNSSPQSKHVQYYDYSDSNVRKFVSDLDTDLSENPPNSLDDFIGTFKANLDKACKLDRPKISKRNPINNPWITGNLVASINKKHKLKNEWIKAKKEYCALNRKTKCEKVKEACHCKPCNTSREMHTIFIDKRRSVKYAIDSET